MNKLKLSEEVLNIIYPIGSVYMSQESTNPSNLFGGVWKRIKGKFIVGVDEEDADFNTPLKTGGSKYIQEHTHSFLKWYGQNISYDPGSGSGTHFQGSLGINTGNGSTSGHMTTGNITSSTKTGNSGNVPPYLALYIWIRTE